MTGISEELAKLAEAIAKRVQAGDTPFDQQLDAFKALTAYQSSLNKVKKRDETEDDDGETTIPKIRRNIRSVT